MSNITTTDFTNSMGLCEGKTLYGKVKFIAKNKDGHIIDEGAVSNNIVLGIRKPIIKLLGGWGATTESLPFIRVLALGESDQTPSVTDTQLGKEIDGSRKLTATVPKVSEDGLSLTFSFLYDMIDDNVDNKDVKEMGLFTTDGTMIARTTVGLWRKTPGLYFEVYWTIGYRE